MLNDYKQGGGLYVCMQAERLADMTDLERQTEVLNTRVAELEEQLEASQQQLEAAQADLQASHQEIASLQVEMEKAEVSDHKLLAAWKPWTTLHICWLSQDSTQAARGKAKPR